MSVFCHFVSFVSKLPTICKRNPLFSIDKIFPLCYNIIGMGEILSSQIRWKTENTVMNRIKTIETKDIAKTVENGGCGECQTSCQSACKTSCGVANQQCENQK